MILVHVGNCTERDTTHNATYFLGIFRLISHISYFTYVHSNRGIITFQDKIYKSTYSDPLIPNHHRDPFDVICGIFKFKGTHDPKNMDHSLIKIQKKFGVRTTGVFFQFRQLYCDIVVFQHLEFLIDTFYRIVRFELMNEKLGCQIVGLPLTTLLSTLLLYWPL